ncbi:MAG: hypothetical protein WC614_06000 [bacterium]
MNADTEEKERFFATLRMTNGLDKSSPYKNIFEHLRNGGENRAKAQKPSTSSKQTCQKDR